MLGNSSSHNLANSVRLLIIQLLQIRETEAFKVLTHPTLTFPVITIKTISPSKISFITSFIYTKW